MSLIQFDIEWVAARRRVATAVRAPAANGPDGWSSSDADPMVMLADFRFLRIRAGFRLTAFQYRASGNGHGTIWAVPDYSNGMLHDWEPTEFRGDRLPRPDGALRDFMEAVEGDGTPLVPVGVALCSGGRGDWCAVARDRLVGGDDPRHVAGRAGSARTRRLRRNRGRPVVMARRAAGRLAVSG
jgi:hypothetical protein